MYHNSIAVNLRAATGPWSKKHQVAARSEDYKGLDTTDRRVKRTHRLLAQALIGLTLDKGYDAVTIRDITDRADVGYATFFRHYPDKEALLLDVLDLVLEELMTLLQPRATASDPQAEGTLIFRFVQEHSSLCQVLLHSPGSALLLERVRTEGVRNALSRNQSQKDGLVPVAIAAHHLVHATLGLVQWWLDNDMPYSPEHMGLIYGELIVRPTRALAFDG